MRKGWSWAYRHFWKPGSEVFLGGPGLSPAIAELRTAGQAPVAQSGVPMHLSKQRAQQDPGHLSSWFRRPPPLGREQHKLRIGAWETANLGRMEWNIQEEAGHRDGDGSKVRF